jgi:predicted dehydrogenase
MKNNKIQMLLVGYGYWGKNLLRNMAYSPDIEVVGVVDESEKSRQAVTSVYASMRTFSSLTVALQETKPAAVVISTPPDSHCKLAVESLRFGCHVLVEKPMAISTTECDEILVEAKKSNRIVMVDHTFVYNPAVRYLGQEIHRGAIGDLLYYDSIRVNLGGFQKTNVLWDLAPHDISILDYLTRGKTPTQVSAIGVRHFSSKVETLCYANFIYEDHFVAHLHLNWAAPTKVRQIMIGGSKKMVIYDDNIPTEKIRTYDKGVDLNHFTENDFRVNYRIGDMVAPAIPQTESLAILFVEFAHCIRANKKPIADGEMGRRVVGLLEAMSQSLEMNGKPVEVPADLNQSSAA